MKVVQFDKANEGEELVAVREGFTGNFIFFKLEDGETTEDVEERVSEDVKGKVVVGEFFET